VGTRYLVEVVDEVVVGAVAVPYELTAVVVIVGNPLDNKRNVYTYTTYSF